MRAYPKLLVSLIPVAPLIFGAAGCAEPEDAGATVQRGQKALTNSNSINLNSINFNSINLNSINLNSINLNALDPATLSADTLSTVQAAGTGGAAARELLRYMVGCALPPNDGLSLEWKDEDGAVHREWFAGLLGLAPEWKSEPLSEAGQEWVSACLASRANFFGVPVEISSRGDSKPLKITGTDGQAESAEFTVREGAFWGNVFAPHPYLRACSHPPEVQTVRAALRTCATGHLDGDGVLVGCGPIELMGSCLEASAAPCSSFNAGDYYKGCVRADGSRTNAVVTTWIR